MQLYLPIAEISVNVFVIVGLGGLVGILSGMFGVGGGFLLTPLLIFYGIPPAVAVASQANQIAGTSVSGAIGHARQGGIDIKMGLMLVIGGLVGSVLGTWIFGILQDLGQIDLTISLSYVVFLGAIGSLMLAESINALRETPGRRKRSRKRKRKSIMRSLPLQMYFPKSKLVISAMVPIVMGVVVGMLVAILGVGGGFIMVPAMIYILGMPTQVVVGTSLLQIVFVTAAVTVLHAVSTQSVDVLLALLLVLGAVFGTQLGIYISRKLRGEQLRGLLALVVLGVAINLAVGLVRPPQAPFSVEDAV